MESSVSPPVLKLSACCISNEFYRVASSSQGKIAVVHASGGAKIVAGEFEKYSDVEDKSVIPGNELIDAATVSLQPPIYEGDQCFTYYEILFAVNSLSSRLRLVLGGADDAHLINRQPGDWPFEPSPVHDQFFDSAEASNPRLQQSSKFKDEYIPRIIGIYMEPSVEYIVAVLSVLRCGEAFMPLDPSWPRERILSVATSSRVDLIIGCEYSVENNYFHQLDNLNSLIGRCCCPVLSISMKNNSHGETELTHLDWPCESKISRSFCYLMYTSGSTGKPKGICGTEQGLLNRFIWMQEMYPLHGDEYLIFKTSISFIDHLQEFLGSLLSSCTLVIPPCNALKENPFCVVGFLQRYCIARLIAVPSLLKLILPSLQSPTYTRVHVYLKMLILSGEVLHQSLCERLLKLLPQTTILNLYGSTEVSGDCTYFDYKRMPLIHERKNFGSVPIGLPISNCKIMLVGENAPNEGEIYVCGLCLGAGYFDYPSIVPLNSVEFPEDACLGETCVDHRLGYYFKTGDYARQLQSGDLVFLGREDRSIKINGQRIALEEIETVFREHPDVFDAAVLCQRDNVEISQIEAHLVLKQKDKGNEKFKSSLRRWMSYRLPQAMVPSLIFFTECLPISSSGKVDYNLLASSCCKTHDKHCTRNTWDGDLLETIKKVFCNALIVENICIDDNFFDLGGNSISAANAAYKLGINMKLLYSFPTPLKLQSALQREIGSATGSQSIHANLSADLGATNESALHGDISTRSYPESNSHKRIHRALSYSSDDNPVKFLKGDSRVCSPKDLKFNCLWNSNLLHTACSFTRCNKTMHSGKCGEKILGQTNQYQQSSGKRPAGSMQEIWKVYMESCVDASPLIIFKENNAYLFIGSHSQKFVCIEAKSGFVMWEVKLDGRIECSAAVVDNFSQVVVGCYQGNIYFLQFSDGSMCWKFQTGGEVKSQPVVDKQRNLVWCGSYDHNLYALDYKNYCCIYKLCCGGSVFGSPAFDELQGKLYVASTSGRVTAISVKTCSAFSELWIKNLEVPIFGSLSINSSNGSIICCMVDSSVVALACDGSIIWRANTGGPIFAGSCISDTLPSQVLVCSRDGSIYSFELGDGKLIWQYATGEPITSSAYVDDDDDESLELVADISSQPGGKFVCVCTSSGSIIVVCVSNLDANGGTRNQSGKIRVEELARLNLGGDIFSSPVMIGGKIFVGCRNDYVYCIETNKK